MTSDGQGSQAIDMAILRGILDIGSESMGRALLTQLMDDFDRLSKSLDADEPAILARASHELKGLAATIGAESLQAMAATLHDHCNGAAHAARAAMILGTRTEMARVRAILDHELASLSQG